jgi:hypothetical protein
MRVQLQLEKKVADQSPNNVLQKRSYAIDFIGQLKIISPKTRQSNKKATSRYLKREESSDYLILVAAMLCCDKLCISGIDFFACINRVGAIRS